MRTAVLLFFYCMQLAGQGMTQAVPHAHWSLQQSAKLDAHALYGLTPSQDREHVPATPVRLTLGDGSEYDLLLTTVTPGSDPDSVVSIGSIVGVESSQVVLVRNKEAVWGKLIVDDGAVYLIHGPTSELTVEHVDTDLLPQEDSPTSDVGEPLSPFVSRRHAALATGSATSDEKRAINDTDDVAVIDVLVVYTAAVLRKAGGLPVLSAAIDAVTAETNQAFVNSNVRMRLNVVHREQVTYNEGGQRMADALTWATHHLPALRNSTGADVVSLWTIHDDLCGTAIPTNAFDEVSADSSPWSVVNYSCAVSEFVFAHELGHLFGAGHDVANTVPGDGYNPYSRGYRIPGLFRTIMAYRCDTGQSCPPVAYWSSPRASFKGQPVGVAGVADNARTIDRLRFVVADWRQRPGEVAPLGVQVSSRDSYGTAETFTVSITGKAIAQLGWVDVLANVHLEELEGCLIRYDVARNALWLATDSGTAWSGSLRVGDPVVLSNRHCSIDGSRSSVIRTANSVLLNIHIAFSTAWIGERLMVYTQAGQTDGKILIGWKVVNAFTPLRANNRAPLAVAVTPSAGSGMSQSFTLVYSDPDGAEDILWAAGKIASTENALPACSFYGEASTGRLWLAADNGQGWLGPISAGRAETIANSQCTISGGGSSLSMAGDYLTLRLALSFRATYSGLKSIYLQARDKSGLNTGWVGKGNWTVLTGGNQQGGPPATASSCSYTLTPQATMVDATASNGSTFNVITSSPNCTWRVSVNANWLIALPESGTGNGTVSYSVYPNYASTARTGAIIVAGQNYVVTQRASSGTSDERFIKLLYFSFFGRLPSDSEVAFQVTQGLKLQGRTRLVLNFLNSAEFNKGGRFIAGLYLGILGRDAEYRGWLFQRNAVARNIVDPYGLVGSFINSVEFRTLNGSIDDAAFVRLLYRQVLLREPSQAEVDFQIQRGVVPYGRVQVAVNFLNAAEFQQGLGPRLTAFLLYACLLQRDPSPEELNLRATQIGQGTSLYSLIGEFLAGSEFNVAVQSAATAVPLLSRHDMDLFPVVPIPPPGSLETRDGIVVRANNPLPAKRVLPAAAQGGHPDFILTGEAESDKKGWLSDLIKSSHWCRRICSPFDARIVRTSRKRSRHVRCAGAKPVDTQPLC